LDWSFERKNENREDKERGREKRDRESDWDRHIRERESMAVKLCFVKKYKKNLSNNNCWIVITSH
jgi:hypothetical protein